MPKLKAWCGGSYVHLGSASDLWWPERDGMSVISKAAKEALIEVIAGTLLTAGTGRSLSAREFIT